MKQSALLLLLACRCAADTGVLLPQGRNEIDASVFSLDEMTVDIVIDNGDASVSIRQIFGNHIEWRARRQLHICPVIAAVSYPILPFGTT